MLIVEGNGSITQIGRSAIWRGELENCVHQNHIIRVRFFGGVDASYANIFLNSPAGQRMIQKVASSTSDLHTLSIGKVESVTFPLPPLAEQRAIVDRVEERLSVADAATAALDVAEARAARLRQSILRDAFTGRLTAIAAEPVDTPARLTPSTDSDHNPAAAQGRLFADVG